MQGALGGKSAGYAALFGPAIDQALSVLDSGTKAVGEMISPREEETYPV
jgi:hypothetical protein